VANETLPPNVPALEHRLHQAEAFIRAVRGLHTPRRRDVDGATLRWCVECQQGWPCMTIQALGGG
jgi:hypothetical protein